MSNTKRHNDHDHEFRRVWFDLAAACELKGINKKTAQNLKWLQPRGGEPDAWIGRKKRWSEKTIAEWIMKTDEELFSEYHNAETE